MASADGPDVEAAGQGLITVEVAWSPGPRQVLLETLRLPPGTALMQALQASGWWARHMADTLASGTQVVPVLPCSGCVFSIWGRRVEPTQPLREGDRIEVCRPLKVDPKEARRQRYRAQGERGRKQGPSRSAPRRRQGSGSS